MKKFAKLLALGLAGAMMLGMTVSAAGSKDTSAEEAASAATAVEETVTVPEGAKVSAIAADQYNETFGTTYKEVVDKSVASPAYAEGVKDITLAGWKVEKATTVVVELTGEASPEKPLEMKLGPDSKTTKYVVGHWNGKAWEDVQVYFRGGDAYVKFTSLSPVSITTLVVTGDGPAPQTAGTPATSTTPVSPKTGETLPVAGMMAVLFLAGAVICAKKARCNG